MSLSKDDQGRFVSKPKLTDDEIRDVSRKLMKNNYKDIFDNLLGIAIQNAKELKTVQPKIKALELLEILFGLPDEDVPVEIPIKIVITQPPKENK